MFDFSGFSGLSPVTLQIPSESTESPAKKRWPAFDLAPAPAPAPAVVAEPLPAAPAPAASPAASRSRGKGPYNGPRRMTARFPGYCRAGDHHFDAGTEIVWSKKRGATCRAHAA